MLGIIPLPELLEFLSTHFPLVVVLRGKPETELKEVDRCLSVLKLLLLF